MDTAESEAEQPLFYANVRNPLSYTAQNCSNWPRSRSPQHSFARSMPVQAVPFSVGLPAIVANMIATERLGPERQ